MSRLVIEAGRSHREYWPDLWRYRELFYVLAWRDISVRYKQTVIGVLWALIQPFMTMIIFTVIFGHFAKMPSEGVPYPLLIFAGILPWQFFAASLGGASQSLVANSNLISKVYFPRLIIPASAVVTALIDFLICFALMAAMMVWYHFGPSWRIALLPGFVLIAFITALGPGLLITALNVQYRDFRYIVPFIIQLGFFVAPVGYSTSIVPVQWRLLYSLNPMVGVIDGFRWALLGGENKIYLPGFFLSLGVTAFLLWLGITYFRKVERSFADVI
jgi:lipopolysaccharide transport system permease protein